MDILAQILSVLACAGIIFSFQLKNNRHLFLVQTISAIGFGLSYLLLGAFNGFFINLISFTNTGVLLLNKKYRVLPIFIAICLGFAASPVITLITFNSVWTAKAVFEIVAAFLVAAVQIAMTFAMWRDDGKIIRIVRLFAASPAWLIYNLAVFSLGGIICEAFNIVSIIISFIRYGKDGFDK